MRNWVPSWGAPVRAKRGRRAGAGDGLKDNHLLHCCFALPSVGFGDIHARIAGIGQPFLKFAVSAGHVLVGVVIAKTLGIKTVGVVVFKPGDKLLPECFLFGCQSKVHLSPRAIVVVALFA